MSGNPYQKIFHRAAMIAADGRVSALCFKRPQAINLRRALWTTTDSAVTCPKCLRRMRRCAEPRE